MRKFNAILSIAILILFLAHGILGGFQMMGFGGPIKWLSHTLMCLIAIHLAIGIKLTADTLKAQKRAGVSYFKENRLFWARRISGFAIMLFLILHLTAFGYTEDGVYRLHYFGAFKTGAQLLLLASVATHILCNVKPLLIGFGIKSLKARAVDILFVLSTLLIFMAAAFIVYYLRWQA